MTLPARVRPWSVPAGTWQAQLRWLVFGQGTAYAIQTVEGLDLPPISAGDLDRATTDGMFGGTETTARRDLVFSLLVHPDSFSGAAKAVLMQAVKAAFAQSSDDVGLTLNHPDLGPLLFIGRPRRVSFAVDRTASWRSQENVLAMFSALDPLIYSATLNDVSIPFGAAGTNAGVPANAAALLGVSSSMIRIIQNGGFGSPAASDGGWVTTVATDLAAGATLTRETGIAHTGGGTSGKLVTSGASTNQGVRQPTLVNLLPNTSYTFTAWVDLTTAGGSIRLLARDVTNAILASSAAAVTTTGTWQQLTVTLVTGATGPVQIMLTARDEGTAVARTFYVTEVRGDLSASVQAWAAPLMGVTCGAIGGGAGASGFVQLVNSGTAAMKPVSRISAVGGPVTGPLHLENVESGQSIILTLNLSAGDVVELDHDLHSVLLNGVTNRADALDVRSVWWDLDPGTNTIHYSAEGPGTGSNAEILYRVAYW